MFLETVVKGLRSIQSVENCMGVFNQITQDFLLRSALSFKTMANNLHFKQKFLIMVAMAARIIPCPCTLDHRYLRS